MWFLKFLSVLVIAVSPVMAWAMFRNYLDSDVGLVMGWVRTAVVTGTLIVLMFKYGFRGGFDDSLNALIVTAASKYVMPAFLLGPVILVVALVLVRLAPPAKRRYGLGLLVGHDAGPGLLMTIIAFWGFVGYAYWFHTWDWVAAFQWSSPGTYAFFVVLPLGISAIIGCVLAMKNLFSAGAAHPLLPPLVTPFFVGISLFFDLNPVTLGFKKVQLLATPDAVEWWIHGIGYALLLGGAVVEYLYVRRDLGVGLRTGAPEISEGDWHAMGVPRQPLP